jgi:hypothetical protein
MAGVTLRTVLGQPTTLLVVQYRHALPRARTQSPAWEGWPQCGHPSHLSARNRHHLTSPAAPCWLACIGKRRPPRATLAITQLWPCGPRTSTGPACRRNGPPAAHSVHHVPHRRTGREHRGGPVTGAPGHARDAEVSSPPVAARQSCRLRRHTGRRPDTPRLLRGTLPLSGSLRTLLALAAPRCIATCRQGCPLVRRTLQAPHPNTLAAGKRPPRAGILDQVRSRPPPPMDSRFKLVRNLTG